MSGVNYPYRYQYEHVAASQTLQTLGGTGAAGDYIHRLVCTVSTALTAAVVIKDGSTGFTHTVLPNSPGGGIGVYNIELNIVSRVGAWQVTTGAGVEVLAIGVFSA
jgi:hypothetical protein